MKDQLVTLAQSLDPHDLLVLKAKLESHGIWCYLADQHSSSSMGAAAAAIGGTKLTIRASDAKKALEILNEHKVKADTDKNPAYHPDQQFKPDDEFVAFIRNPKNKDKWVNLAKFSNEDDLIAATNILTEDGIEYRDKTIPKKTHGFAEEFSLAVKLGDISQAVEVLAIRMESGVYFEPAADEYFEMLYRHQTYELPDDPDEKNYQLREKKIADRNAKLTSFAYIFFLSAIVFLILYGFFEEFLKDYFR